METNLEDLQNQLETNSRINSNYLKLLGNYLFAILMTQISFYIFFVIHYCIKN